MNKAQRLWREIEERQQERIKAALLLEKQSRIDSIRRKAREDRKRMKQEMMDRFVMSLAEKTAIPNDPSAVKPAGYPNMKPFAQNPSNTIDSGAICFECHEADPQGKSQHESGAKLDAGKNRVGLVINGFANALWCVSQVGTFGAQKYTDNGWKDVPNGIERYTDAMHRHLLIEATGQDYDSQTDLLHAAHTAWNALARLELLLNEKSGRAGPRVIE